jgi:hypothetical protein
MNRKTKILIGVFIVGIVLVSDWWIWNQKAERVPTKEELKTCSANSDCILVETIIGLDHIPIKGEECGCECITSINKKFKKLWEEKQNEFRNYECKKMCKPCAFTMENSRAKCENEQCVVKPI